MQVCPSSSKYFLKSLLLQEVHCVAPQGVTVFITPPATQEQSFSLCVIPSTCPISWASNCPSLFEGGLITIYAPRPPLGHAALGCAKPASLHLNLIQKYPKGICFPSIHIRNAVMNLLNSTYSNNNNNNFNIPNFNNNPFGRRRRALIVSSDG